MVIQLQTSFTPRKSPIIGPSRLGMGTHGVNLLAIFSLVIFTIAVGLSIAVFFYKSHFISVISDMDAELAKAKKSFEPTFIEEASRLNARISGTQELLNHHLALSPLFDVLEHKTLGSVRFQDFNFSVADEESPSISMTGQAKSFNAVALQSDVFGGETSFKDPVFSNFSLNDDGDVVFNFQTTIDPKLLLYRETILGASGAEKADTVSSKTGTVPTFDGGGDGTI